jgi:hypothetical protein
LRWRENVRGGRVVHAAGEGRADHGRQSQE